MAITTSRFTPLALLEMSSSFERPSGLMVALSKSKSTSAAKVTFSATGFGFSGSGLGFSGSGFGAGGGAGFTGGGGGGVGAGGGAGLGSGFGGSVAQPAANASAATSIRSFFIFVPPLLEKLFGSGICVSSEQILPHPRLAFQAWCRVLQRSVAHAQRAVDPN